MPLSPAEKQKRYRERRKTEEQMTSDAIEQSLLEEAARADLSSEERIALAEKITDLAMDFLHRAQRLSRIAFKARTGSDHPR
jgi:hypothetical protein